MYAFAYETPQALDKGANHIAYLKNIRVGLPDYYPKLLSKKFAQILCLATLIS